MLYLILINSLDFKLTGNLSHILIHRDLLKPNHLTNLQWDWTGKGLRVYFIRPVVCFTITILLVLIDSKSIEC